MDTQEYYGGTYPEPPEIQEEYNYDDEWIDREEDYGN